MPIMTQQYLTVVYIFYYTYWAGKEGGQYPLNCEVGGQIPPLPLQFRRLCAANTPQLLPDPHIKSGTTCAEQSHWIIVSLSMLKYMWMQ